MTEQTQTALMPTLNAGQTKYEGVRETVRAWIRDGVYAPGALLPSEKELPGRMGVSKITVVRALNDLAAEGVIVRRHGKGSFVADPSHQPLLPNRFLRLGVLFPTLLTSDFRNCMNQREVLTSALKLCGLDEVEPVFHQRRSDQFTRAHWTSEPRGCRIELLGEAIDARLHHPPLAAVRAARLDGILAVSIVEEPWLAELLELGVPTVLADCLNTRFAARADQVFFDPVPGFRAAVRALVAANLRRIHFVGCWSHLPYVRRVDALTDKDHFSPAKARPDPDTLLRKAAWRLAMDEVGLPCPAEWDHIAWFRGASLQALAERLVSLPEAQRPQAVVCHAIEHAEYLVEAFRARGLPLQAAGVTAGKHRHMAWPIYADHARLGQVATELLLRRIQQPTSFLQTGVPLVLPDYVAAPGRS